MTIEQRERVRLGDVGHHPSIACREASRNAHIGSSMPDATRIAIRKAQIGRPMPESVRMALDKANEGRIVSLETRAKQSAVRMGHVMPESTRAVLLRSNIGSHRSDEVRAKMSVNHWGARGELNPNWQGGITLAYRKRANDRRRALGPIDMKGFAAKCADLQWVCQLCGKILTPETVTIDHIVPVVKGGTNALENLQSLCMHCNSLKRDKPMSVVVGSQFLFD